MWRQPNFNALANRVSRSSDVVKQNIYGFTVGNPIIKNKLFNFFAFEKWYAQQPSNYIATIPTVPRINGRLHRAPSGTTAYARVAIYDPNTTVFNPIHDTAYSHSRSVART